MQLTEKRLKKPICVEMWADTIVGVAEASKELGVSQAQIYRALCEQGLPLLLANERKRRSSLTMVPEHTDTFA